MQIKTAKIFNYLSRKRVKFAFSKQRSKGYFDCGTLSDVQVGIDDYSLVDPDSNCFICGFSKSRAIWTTQYNFCNPESGWYCKECLARYGVPT